MRPLPLPAAVRPGGAAAPLPIALALALALAACDRAQPDLTPPARQPPAPRSAVAAPAPEPAPPRRAPAPTTKPQAATAATAATAPTAAPSPAPSTPQAPPHPAPQPQPQPQTPPQAQPQAPPPTPRQTASPFPALARLDAALARQRGRLHDLREKLGHLPPAARAEPTVRAAVGFLGGAQAAAVRHDPVLGARLAADGLALLGDVARAPGAAWLWLGDYGDPLYRAERWRRHELLARVADPTQGLAAAAAVLALWEADDLGTPAARADGVRRLGDVARAAAASGWQDLATLTARLAARSVRCVPGPAPTDKDPSPVAPSDPALDAVRALVAAGDEAGARALVASLQPAPRRQAARRALRRWRPSRRGPDEAERATARALDAGDLTAALKTLGQVDTDDAHAVAELAARALAVALPPEATTRAWQGETVRALSTLRGRTQTAWLLALAEHARAAKRTLPDGARAALLRALAGASRWRPPKSIPAGVVPAPLEAGLRAFRPPAPLPAQALRRRAEACGAWEDPSQEPPGGARRACEQGPPRVPLVRGATGKVRGATGKVPAGDTARVAWLDAVPDQREAGCVRLFLVQRAVPTGAGAGEGGDDATRGDARELLGVRCAAPQGGDASRRAEARARTSFETTRAAWRRVGELLGQGFAPARSLVNGRAVDVAAAPDEEDPRGGQGATRPWIPLVSLGAPLDGARILLARRPRAVDLTLVAPGGRRARVLRRWASPPPCAAGAAPDTAAGDGAEAPEGRVEDVLLGGGVLVVRGATYPPEGAERRWVITAPRSAAQPPGR